MSTMIDKMIAKATKDVEKAQKGIERHTKWAEKKEAKCRKLDCLWTDEEFEEHRDNGTMTNDQWAAYFDYYCNQKDIKEYERQLTMAYKHLDKVLNKADDKAKKQEEEDHLTAMTTKYETQEVDYEKWLAEFKAECLKDGIVIEDATSNFISGLTKNSKQFAMSINNGFTYRSWHSYTLYIEGETIFTSGLFETGYRYIMSH